MKIISFLYSSYPEASSYPYPMFAAVEEKRLALLTEGILCISCEDFLAKLRPDRTLDEILT